MPDQQLLKNECYYRLNLSELGLIKGMNLKTNIQLLIFLI
jgi:hypothetical protein